MIYIKRFFKAIWVIVAVIIGVVISTIGVLTTPLTQFIYYVVKGDLWDMDVWFHTIFTKLGVNFND